MKFENTEVFNFKGALRGMRQPMQSHEKSDSHYWLPNEHIEKYEEMCDDDISWEPYYIGENDMALAQRLISGGPVHSKFLRQIMVSVDITAADYFFKEFDTYRIGVTENSTSTMHKIMSKPFVSEMFECEDMRGYKKKIENKPNEIDEETEIWKVHPIYNNYEISNQGRVKHLQYLDTSNALRKEKILVGSFHSDGYIFVSICLGHQKYKQIAKHRLVAETFIDNPNNYPEVNHIDGNKQNNNVNNLEWVTSSQNQLHAVKTCLQPKQVYFYRGKLNKEKRDEIIFRYNTEETSIRKLAKEYDVSHSTICSVINNKYNYGENINNEYEEFLKLLDKLNELRDEYLITQDKTVWKTLIQLLPMSYLYTRTVTMNYEVLRNMYKWRKNHKLSEWRKFCNEWIPNLPYADKLIMWENEINNGLER